MVNIEVPTSCGYPSTATLLVPVLAFDLQHFDLEIALTLPAQLLRPLICSLSVLARSQHGCLCFMHVSFPAAVSHGAAIPALLPLADWHSCCALQVFPAKAMEIWLLTLTAGRAGRGPAGPAGCELWPRSLGLVQSLFANRFILGLSGFRLLSLSCHETDTSGFLVVLLDVVACMLLWQGCCTYAGGHAKYWSRPLAAPPATQVNGARGKKGVEMKIQHHFCSTKYICRSWSVRIQTKASCGQKLWRNSAIDRAGKNKRALECAINNCSNGISLSLPARIA